MNQILTKVIWACFIGFLLHQSILAKSKQPNILWIITDDQRADALECYHRATTGKSKSYLGYVISPNIDKLADEGTMFINAYNNSPMCVISRASMHMGRYTEPFIELNILLRLDPFN